MQEAIVVINAGSSSIKFAVYASAQNARSFNVHYRGKLTGIGHQNDFALVDNHGDTLVITDRLRTETSKIRTHDQALSVIVNWINGQAGNFSLIAAGHRVVHGGEKFSSPVMVNEAILSDLKSFIPLAPLHQPYQISAIEILAELYPGMVQIACFDTAFHRNQPYVAQQFALPRSLQQQGIIRYGFHGLSYEYIADILPEYMGNAAEGRVIVAHLGQGASMCAMQSRRSIATTMSFSPLDGLPMGTRCGTLDPAVIFFLVKEKGMDIDAVSELLNYQSGLIGVSGISSDMQELLDSDDPHAKEAIDLFVYRASRELGSLTAALNGLDALVFTAGIGEHAHRIRERICRQASWLGIHIDKAANVIGRHQISTTKSPVSVWVVPTDEERMIARHVTNTIEKNYCI
ncbi:acetate kinase [Nitrosomonas marina]|uniref:Acetate kinase n=1 Tax=Nitrosomonas marina TaxID=917 RepID=A0A1H9ZYF4_9PROT|nr:acetate/propionate family kinase [Nitrosomonas marina]SES86794.1 acetate kinase [Nitrosomonas marina]